jgi:hypothetical protein
LGLRLGSHVPLQGCFLSPVNLAPVKQACFVSAPFDGYHRELEAHRTGSESRYELQRLAITRGYFLLESVEMSRLDSGAAWSSVVSHKSAKGRFDRRRRRLDDVQREAWRCAYGSRFRIRLCQETWMRISEHPFTNKRRASISGLALVEHARTRERSGFGHITLIAWVSPEHECDRGSSSGRGHRRARHHQLHSARGNRDGTWIPLVEKKLATINEWIWSSSQWSDEVHLEMIVTEDAITVIEQLQLGHLHKTQL